MGTFINEDGFNAAVEFYVGIDNGLKGAVVVLDQQARLVAWWDTPTVDMGKGKGVKTEFAPAEMGKIVHKINKDGPAAVRVWLEVAQAMPKQGLSSTFKTGKGAGLWEGIVVGACLPYDVVHPRTWTAEVLRDIPKGDPKKRSMLKCLRILPTLPLTKPRGSVLCMDGRSDAALLAYFGWLKQRGGEDPNQIKRRPVKKKKLKGSQNGR